MALEFLSKSVKIALKINDKKTLISCYKYIGYIYAMNDPYLAQVYYVKSIKLARELNDFVGESYALSAIGNIYEGMLTKKGNFKIALHYYLKSLGLREKYGDDSEVSSSLNEISRVYRFLGMQAESSKYLFRALKIAESFKSIYDFENLIYIYSSLGNDYVYRLKDYKTGLKYELKAYNLCLKIPDNIELMFDITKVIALTYSNLGLIKEANLFYAKSINYGDSIKARTNKYDYNLSSIKHSLENKLNRQHYLLNKAEVLKSHSEQRRQRTLRNTIIIGFSFWLFLIILILRSFNQNKKSNKILNLKNKQIQASFSLIEEQNKIVEDNNSKLTQLLIDKEILFKEVHHRVKNNLQIISSLLNLQSNTISDKVILDVLKQSQSRINTMAILHNKLYQTVDFTNVPIEEYLNQLVSSISDSFKIENCVITFEINADSDIVLNIDSAIPFGLILNELVTNSFKHAFKGKQEGLIKISLIRLEEDNFQLIYKDNGCGLVSNYKELSEQSLGLELIDMLVLQLNGRVVVKNGRGVEFQISFESRTDNND